MIGAVLADAGEEVTLFVRPGTESLYPREISLKSPFRKVRAAVLVTASFKDPLDILWVTVKATQLSEALQRIPTNFQANVICPLLNGIDHVERLRDRFGHEQIIMYMMSFITLGIFWVGQQTQLNYLARSSRNLAWIHIGFLFAVTITPFSTRLLAEFPAYRIALLTYWVNLLLLGITLYFSWVCAEETGVVKDEMRTDVPAAIKRRIVIGCQ